MKKFLNTLKAIVSLLFSRMMLSPAARYGMASIVILGVVAGFALWSIALLHLPALHVLSDALQLFNKVPFGEPWPQ